MAQPRPCSRPAAWGLFLLVLLPTLLQTPALWRAEAPEFMDVLTTFYPIRTHAARLLADAQPPLWNRSVYAGVPLLANPQWGLLYPGHWPFLLAPNARVFTAINIAHIAWLGIGVFIWLRRALQRSKQEKPMAGPLLGGLLIQLGGWTWAHLAFGAYLQAAAWMPWTLWAFARGLEAWERASGRWTRSVWLWAAGGGLAGAMQWLVGAPQLALYCQAGAVFYILLTGWMRRPRRRSFGMALLWVLVAEATALGLSAPQWMTSHSFMLECERQSGLSQAEVAAGAVSLRGLTQAWVGGTGRPFEDAEQILYPGWLALALALSAGLGWAGKCSLERRREKLTEEKEGPPERQKRDEKKQSFELQTSDGASPEKVCNETSTIAGLFALLSVSCLFAWKGAVPILFQIP